MNITTEKLRVESSGVSRRLEIFSINNQLRTINSEVYSATRGIDPDLTSSYKQRLSRSFLQPHVALKHNQNGCLQLRSPVHLRVRSSSFQPAAESCCRRYLPVSS